MMVIASVIATRVCKFPIYGHTNSSLVILLTLSAHAQDYSGHFVVQHGISKMADFYPFCLEENQKLSLFN